MVDSQDILAEFPHFKDLPPTLDDTTTGTPDRRPGSVRRTSTIDMTWPGGPGTPLALVGRARDLLTSVKGEPRLIAEASMQAGVDAQRTVTSLEATPSRDGIEALVGARGGAELRTAIDRALPGERESATPLHLLLDDIAGASLIAGFAWSRSRPGEELRERLKQARIQQGPGDVAFGVRKGRIICSGLRPDGWAEVNRRYDQLAPPAVVPAGDIRTPNDPYGWHEFLPAPEVGMRRHRRIDVWHEAGALMVDAFFRDACWDPDGSQQALHEYSVSAVVDEKDHTLVSVQATPHVLPFPECKWAAPHAKQVEGLPVTDFRSSIPKNLTELQACTHLNDMLRCLAEVPALAAALQV